MCPYARFQSAMFDQDTLVVSYDGANRGEPRGRGAEAPRRPPRSTRNSAIASTVALCVQVCPTGIDIRDGMQYECITCAACIDACDSVMDKVGYPRGLVKYTTAHALTGAPQRVLRKRTVFYGAVLLALVAVWIAGVALRSPVALDVLRDRNALYRLDDDAVENVYLLKVINRDSRDHRYDVSAAGSTGSRSRSRSARPAPPTMRLRTTMTTSASPPTPTPPRRSTPAPCRSAPARSATSRSGCARPAPPPRAPAASSSPSAPPTTRPRSRTRPPVSSLRYSEP